MEDAQQKAERKARDTAEAIRIFEMYQREATVLHLQAQEHGINDVKFIGTGWGVLAVESSPGAIKLALARADWPGGEVLREMIETEGYSTSSPDVRAIIPPEQFGGSYIRRTAEQECRRFLRDPDRSVSLFRRRWDEPNGCSAMVVNPGWSGFTAYPFYDWDEELEDLPDSDGVPIETIADFLAGDGYQVE